MRLLLSVKILVGHSVFFAETKFLPTAADIANFHIFIVCLNGICELACICLHVKQDVRTFATLGSVTDTVTAKSRLKFAHF